MQGVKRAFMPLGLYGDAFSVRWESKESGMRVIVTGGNAGLGHPVECLVASLGVSAHRTPRLAAAALRRLVKLRHLQSLRSASELGGAPHVCARPDAPFYPTQPAPQPVGALSAVP